EVRPARDREAERHVRRYEHLPRRDQPPGGHPYGTQPILGVRAAARVGVVVRKVRPDLDEYRAEQRRDERERVKRAGAERERGADEDRRDRRGQRAHARRHQPDAKGHPRAFVRPAPLVAARVIVTPYWRRSGASWKARVVGLAL